MLGIRRTAGIAGLLAACLLLGCARQAGLGVRAPSFITQALDVVTELGATATLRPRGGEALPAVPLDRGDDGVTFLGFIDAAPGDYVIEIVFSGLLLGGGDERAFLGRLTSDPFAVIQGQAAAPAFTQPLDTIGRAGDGGDEDGDGLGLLLELILGADASAADSDNDGVRDGEDCAPVDPTNSFVIVEGGSLTDCDGDGFEAAVPLIGPSGDDCDDTDDLVNPAASDDCGTVQDSDCNPATCPIDDADGPTVALVTPAVGVAVGCQATLVIAASDASGVQSVFAQLPDRPISGGYQRTLSFTDNGDGTWSSTGLNSTGPGLQSGEERLIISASDERGNSSTTETTLAIELAFPAVTWSAPATLSDEPISISVTPQSPRPLVTLEIRSASLDASGLVSLADMATVATLPTTGGSAEIDPGALVGNVALFPFAIDDVGNTLLPYHQAFANSGRVTADYRCDGVNHELPVAVRIAGRGRVTALHYLQEALDLMAALDSTHDLVKVIGFGLQDDGTIDLSSADYIFLGYYFNDAAGGNGKSVIYYSSAAGYASQPFPAINEDDGSLSDGNAMEPSSLIDSDTVVAAYPCGGVGPSGQGTDDMVMYIRNDGNAFDSLYLSTADGYAWGAHAADLSVNTFGCSTP